jgi:hypothetical protein
MTELKHKNKEVHFMIHILFFVCIAMIGYLNYTLLKSYWCHEGVWGERIDEQ